MRPFDVQGVARPPDRKGWANRRRPAAIPGERGRLWLQGSASSSCWSPSARRSASSPSSTARALSPWAVVVRLGARSPDVRPCGRPRVERAGRRLLPLVTLLKLSMLFPDQAPTRFSIARTAGAYASSSRAWWRSRTTQHHAKRAERPPPSCRSLWRCNPTIDAPAGMRSGFASSPTSWERSSSYPRTIDTACDGRRSCTTSASSRSRPRS